MINLLPPDIKQSTEYGRRNVAAARYLALVIAALAAAALIMLGANYYGQQHQARLDNEYEDLQEKLGPVRGVTEQAKVVEAKLNILRSLFEAETNYVALLEDIEKTIVPGAQLQQLELNGDETKPLEMRFIVTNELVAATLRNSLEASDRFSYVDIQDITTTTGKDEQAEITATYKLSYEPGKAR